MKKTTFYLIFTLCIFAIICSLYSTYSNNKKYKEFIIDHRYEIIKIHDNCYLLEIKNNYYRKATIKIYNENDYSVVFWGNRNNWLWPLKKDTYFYVDIPYDNYKNLNTTLDVKILEILKSIK